MERNKILKDNLEFDNFYKFLKMNRKILRIDEKIVESMFLPYDSELTA